METESANTKTVKYVKQKIKKKKQKYKTAKVRNNKTYKTTKV